MVESCSHKGCVGRQMAAMVMSVALLVPPARDARGQALHLQTRLALVDEQVRVWVTGLAPDRAIVVYAARKDPAGRLWQSYAGFRADAHGVVDLSTTAPANASYTGLAPMGLFTSMDVAGESRGHLRYSFTWRDTLRTEISVEVDGRLVTADTLSQVFAAAGVHVRVVRDSGIVGTLFVSDGSVPHAPVLVLGGSEGGVSNEDLAAQLASRGYAALAVGYFAEESLPPALDRIPIEYFERALRLLSRMPGVARESPILFGTSKGAEAALVLGSRIPDVRAVVAYLPSSVVWSCICAAPHASWTVAGSDLPNVAAGTDPTYRPPTAAQFRPAVNYQFRMREPATRAAAAIAVERIKAPVLMVAGMDDGIWPSAEMAREIEDRRRRAGLGSEDVLLVYPNAGHLIGKAYLPVGTTVIGGGRVDSGGTVAGDATAQAASWPRVLEFMRRVAP